MDNSISPFEELAEEYDGWFDGDGRLIFEIEVEALRSVLPHLSKPWLEIGAGSGRFAQALGIEKGVEPSKKFVEIARNRGIEAVSGRGEDSIFAPESFGTVFIILTFCFLTSPREVLKEVNRILVPSGKLVLGLILKDSPWGKYNLAKKARGHRYYSLARFYGIEEVNDMLAQAGFSPVEVYSTLYQLPEQVIKPETPCTGYDSRAGFTVLTVRKNTTLGL